MNLAAPLRETRDWSYRAVEAWDRFWFTARSPYLLSLLRIATGLFLLYSHLVLATDLSAFLGADAWIKPELARSLHDGMFGNSDWGLSYLWFIDNSFLLWMHHLLTIAVTTAFTIGLCTRVSAPAAWLLQLMYIHRLTGALFGLDQIITYMVMYLSLAPCGSFFSVDVRIRKRLADKLDARRWLNWLFPDQSPSVAANVATRLWQLHLCVIYLFGGLAKARGESWWDGTAMWFAVGNYEYQSLDMTWMAAYPRLFSTLTHVALFWEVFYCCLIWPRLLRPVTLLIAVAVHGGIALFLGMATFGLAMICANAAFIDPDWLRRLVTGRELDASDAELDDPELEIPDLGDSDLGDSGLGDSGLGDSDFSEADFGDADINAKILERARKVRKAGRNVRKRYLMLKEREKTLQRETKELERQKRRFARRVTKEGEKPPES